MLNKYHTNNWCEFYGQIHNILTHGDYYNVSIYRNSCNGRPCGLTWLDLTINPSLLNLSDCTLMKPYGQTISSQM